MPRLCPGNAPSGSACGRAGLYSLPAPWCRAGPLPTSAGPAGKGFPRLKTLSVALALIGLLIGTLLVGASGFGRVAQGVLSAGWGGFGLYVGWQLLMFIPLGLAWDTLARGLGVQRAGLFIWGRMVRDAATNCLPFSQLGGFFAGARAIMAHGAGWPLATATTVVDVTAEFLAEVLFAVMGILVVLVHNPHAAVRVPFAIGLAVALAAAVAFIWVQRGFGSLFTRIAERIASDRLDGAKHRVERLQVDLDLLYRHRARLGVGVALHLLGWMASGVGTFIAYRALGAQISLVAALAIEALLSAIAAAAFLVPANIGVQEAGYAGLGALFGMPVELSLAVSLLRRARDLAVGVPILLVWQGLELRALRATRLAARSGDGAAEG